MREIREPCKRRTVDGETVFRTHIDLHAAHSPCHHRVKARIGNDSVQTENMW
jgi:hypothetical protein